MTQPGNTGLPIGTQDLALASEDNVFDELKTTRSTSWQFELRQMEKRNRLLAEELQSLQSSRKKRKRRNGAGQVQKDCANCHTRVTPEWRRGPSGNRDLCNSCGLRWAKQNGRVSPRTNSQQSESPAHSSPRPTEMLASNGSNNNINNNNNNSSSGSSSININNNQHHSQNLNNHNSNDNTNTNNQGNPSSTNISGSERRSPGDADERIRKSPDGLSVKPKSRLLGEQFTIVEDQIS